MPMPDAQQSAFISEFRQLYEQIRRLGPRTESNKDSIRHHKNTAATFATALDLIEAYDLAELFSLLAGSTTHTSENGTNYIEFPMGNVVEDQLP